MGSQISQLEIDGDTYEGGVTDGKIRHGLGQCHFSNGDDYSGDWENDHMNGQGRYQHANGDLYVGSFRNDRRHGIGVYIAKDSWKYEGEWVNDLMQGIGQMIDHDQVKSEGMWLKGFPHGVGSLIHPNGYFYVTEWYMGEIINYICDSSRSPSLIDSNLHTESDLVSESD
jgi:hypothetical protein